MVVDGQQFAAGTQYVKLPVSKAAVLEVRCLKSKERKIEREQVSTNYAFT
jgi:hypothetical protein